MRSLPNNELGEPTHPLSRSWFCLSTVLAVACFVRLVSIFLVRNYLHPNTWEFGELAQPLYDGHGFTKVLETGVRVPSAHMPPLYPYLLASLWKVFGQSSLAYLGFEVFQSVFGVLLVFYTYRLARILCGTMVAMVAASLVAIWPPLVYLCNEIHSISIYIVLGTAAVYYLVRFTDVSREWKDVAGFGISMGLLLLCRAEAIVLLVAYCLILVWRCGRGFVPQAIVACLLAGACISPWTIRNYKAFGQLVLISTSGGFNLWVGNNGHATGNSYYNFYNLTAEQQALYYKALDGRDTEIRINRVYGHAALDFIRHNPKAELLLALRKLFFFVFFDPTHKKSSQIGYWLPSLTLTTLGCWGIWIRRKHLLGRDLPTFLSILCSLLLAVVFFALPRYRIAIDPFVAIFAANAIVSLRWGRSGTHLPPTNLLGK